MFGQAIGKGFLPDVHCPTGAPRESIVKITQGRAGRHRGQGAVAARRRWACGPRYESDAMKRYLARRVRRAARARRRVSRWLASTTGRSAGRCPTGIRRAGPQRQFAAVFDINKCIACQTCTLACKTTWTSGKGQEYMLWNNVETKPYGFYPLAWDVEAARAARARSTWNGGALRGPHDLRGGAGRRARARLAARGARLRVSQRRRGRLRRARSTTARDLHAAAHDLVLLPGAHLQPLHLSRRAWPPARAARSTSARRTASCCVDQEPLPRLPGVRARPAPTRRSSSTR